jgi:hypothetical protein
MPWPDFGLTRTPKADNCCALLSNILTGQGSTCWPGEHAYISTDQKVDAPGHIRPDATMTNGHSRAIEDGQPLATCMYLSAHRTTSIFQADHKGSIPFARSTEKPQAKTGAAQRLDSHQEAISVFSPHGFHRFCNSLPSALHPLGS